MTLYELTTDGRFEIDAGLEAAKATARRIGLDDLDPADLNLDPADDAMRPRPGHPVSMYLVPDEPPMSAEEVADYEAAVKARYGPDDPPPIRDARDLLFSLGDHLTALGLEPDTRGDELTFLAFGRPFSLRLTDLEHRPAGRVSHDELAMLAARMPVG